MYLAATLTNVSMSGEEEGVGLRWGKNIIRGRETKLESVQIAKSVLRMDWTGLILASEYISEIALELVV